MLRIAIAGLALMLVSTPLLADNTAEACYLNLPGHGRTEVGMVCYNHHLLQVHESHIRERCNKSVPACQIAGGCYADSCANCGQEAPECANHDGANYATVYKPYKPSTKPINPLMPN